MLTDAVFNEKSRKTVLSEVDRKDIVGRMKQELGENNALTMLVALTTKFDVPTVTKIIERLENLRDSI